MLLLPTGHDQDHNSLLFSLSPAVPPLQRADAASEATQLRHPSLARPPATLPSPWELQRNRGLLAMEQQVRQLEAQLGEQQSKSQAGKENTPPPSAPVPPLLINTLRPATLLGPSTFYTTGSAQGADQQMSGQNKLGVSSTESTGEWERSKARALLQLEGERNELAQRLALHQQAAAEAEHERQARDQMLRDMQAAHEQVLWTTQDAAQRKLQALHASVAAVFARWHCAQRASRILRLWHKEAQHSKRLRQAEHVWLHHRKEFVFVEWMDLWLQSRWALGMLLLHMCGPEQVDVDRCCMVHLGQFRRALLTVWMKEEAAVDLESMHLFVRGYWHLQPVANINPHCARSFLQAGSMA